MQGHRKYSDGFSDTSSSGSFMDETDREVSNLTDRAFRSLCIGEEAIYNDSEFSSSPTERHKAFAEKTKQRTTLQRSSQETFSYSVQHYEESEMTSTFQHSYVDVNHQEQALRDVSLSYNNNGSKEMTWQQGRSASRVSSLIKAFSSGECYQDSGTGDVILAKDKYRDFGNESWNKSALLSIQRELSEFSAGYHQNFKSGPFQSYKNHFFSSDVAQMDTTILMKPSISKFKAMNSKNCFFHSEFSPFQLWEEYNRFPFEKTEVSGFMSSSEFPRWYDSPMYKELKDTHTISNSPFESRSFNQRQIQDFVPSQRSRSTVIQKASAIEKRCDSEMASNCPPWKKNNSFVRNKLPSNRPSTVSPTNEKKCRPDSSLFSYSKVTHDVQRKVVNSTLPSSITPFNITKLLTPIIHTRQETETSEILQFAHTPSISDYCSQGETDPKPLTDAKHLSASYKTRASHLLFNLKDNRKRVKSTYSPTRFKGLDITDRHKQTSKLEGRESRFSDILVSQETPQENFVETDIRVSCNRTQELNVAPVTPKNNADAIGSYDNLTLTSPQIQDGAFHYKSFCGSSDGLLAYTKSTQYEPSSYSLSTQNKSSVNLEGQLKDLNSTFSPTTRPEIASMLPKSHPPTQSLPAQTLEQHRYGLSDNASQNDLQQKKDFGRKTYFEYSQNEVVKERCPWDQTGSVNSADRETSTNNGRSEARPFRGEIAALIEMDKQRKATAKQYLPTANDSFSVQKETYMRKVNDDIKLGRRAKDEEKVVREDTISRKNSYHDKPLHDNPLNKSAKPIDPYGIPKNIHQYKISSPPMEVNVYGGLQSCTAKNDLEKEILASERSPEQYVNSIKISDQSTLYAPLFENKCQKNEGLLSYQPYRYEPNKQWHMASTNEDRHVKDSVLTLRQSESYKISNTLPNTQPNTLHATMVNQNELSTKDVTPNPDSVIPTIDNSDQNNPCSPNKREDRFSINDILAIRDNEQAKRIKENTYAGNLAKSENPQNQIKHDIAENKATITEIVKEQEQTARGYKIQDSASPAPCYLRKDNDKVATRAISCKERGQSKQEILTSKLKAHAQKEISAIKEKGLAKQGILARNATKPGITINNEKAQDGQEVHCVKKEITAEKLNHLFQDITYSSVTQYKNDVKTQDDYTKYGSPPSGKKQPTEVLNSQEESQTAVLENKSEYVKSDKLLATEKQNESVEYDRCPDDDKEITKASFTTSIQDRVTTVRDLKHKCKHDVQKNIKNYQPTKSKDEQICRTSSEDIHPNEKFANQSLYVHETSPSEMMPGSHLTSPLKTENYTSHKPPALCVENQKVQPDKKEKAIPKYHPFGSAGASSLTQHAYTGEALTKPTDVDTIRKDERPSLTNTANQKANSGINENSQKSTNGQDGLIPLGLDRNTQRVKEVNVHHKSGISAVAEQSKNELIKNSSRISASQLTSSSSDIKLNIGIPPDKLLTESAKSELTSKLKANTMEDAEQIKNGMYKHNSGVNSDVTPVSSTKNIVKHNNVTTNDQFLQRTEEKETQKHLVNEDGAGLISKNNTRMENDLAQQQSDTSPVKVVETTSANQMFGNQSESRQTELIHMESAKESCQQKELLQDDENTKPLLSVGENEHLRSHQTKSRTKNESEAVFNNQHLKEVSREKKILGSASSKHIQAGKGGDFNRSSEKNPKSTKDFQEVASKVPGSLSKAKNAEDDPQEANASTQNTAIMQEGTTQKYNDAVLTPSKEEPVVEPMIYSICVSSKTETVSDDEPMIFSICVSSKCHVDEPQNPVNHEEGSAETEVSAARCVIRSEENESVHDKSDHHASIGRRETEVSSNNRAENELPIRKPEPPTTDKQDCYKVSDVGSISSSYEDLLAKYGLRDHGYATSKHHMQDNRKIKNTEESETPLSQKPMKHEVNRSLSTNEKSSDTQIFPKDSRQTSNQQASLRTTQLLKETAGKTKQQAKQHSDSPSITHSDYKVEKQLITGNDRANLGLSTSYPPLVPTDTANAEQQDQDSKDTEAFNRRNDDVQPKDTTFEEQVINTEIVQRLKTENNADDVSNSRMSSMKTENVFLTAKQPTATGDSKSTAKTAEVLKTTISKASVALDALVKTKPNETTSTGRTIPHNNHKPQKEDTEDKMLNHASDSLLTQKNEKHISKTCKTEDQKIQFGAKQDNFTALAKESVSVRDGQALQNLGKGDVGEKKAQSEQGQVGFNTSNEITDKMKMVSKDGADTHVNNYLGKVYSIGEDVCTVVKQGQTSSEVSKIHLEDIKVSTKEVLSNEEYMADHKNQHGVIKIESLRVNRGAVVTACVGENFSEQNESPAKSLIAQNEPETQDNMKGTSEMTPKQKDDIGQEITPPPKKDSPMQTPMLQNIGEDSTSDIEKTEVNLRGGAVWTQEIKAIDSKRTALNSDKGKNKDPEVSSPSGHNDNGNLKVDENRCSLRRKKQINGEAMEMQANDQYNTNQYQQGKGLVPETKGNADEQGYAQFSQQGIGRESILSKPEATQRGKKVTRPEILAIADYARLKVISAEEDDAKEIDILPKMDIYNSHDLPVLGIRKHLHKNVPLLNTAGESKREVISNEKEKGKILKQRPLHFQERGKESFLSQKQNHSNPSISTPQPKLSLVASSSEDEAFVFEGLGGTKDRALINHKESNTKPDFMEQINRGGHHKIYPSKNPQGANILQSQANGKSDYFRSRQLSCDNAIEKDNLSHSGKQNLPLKCVSGTMKTEDNSIKMVSPAGEEMDELQYYTVNAFDRDIKPKETTEPSPLSHKMTQNKILSENFEEEKKEDKSLIDYSKVNASGPQSNSSSPAMGKPAMFRVKDNTIRNTSVTKTVKPCFHRSFSDDFRIGSPKEHLSGSEKGDEEHFQYKESANPPVLHNPAIASHRLHKLREAPQNSLTLAECTAKQSKGLQRRSKILEDEETLSVISTMSEDVENCAGSIVDMSDKSAAYMPKNESYRNTYQRSASACYDRPESACSERPESACSDMRQLGKPPVVPPKSEKALRRAQRLTTRRMKKTETQTPENQEQQVPKSIQNFSSVPSSPLDIESTPLAVQATPPLSQYGIEPNYTTPMHSMVAQPFPMTHRKLLQDPNSGQYFMVDMPLTVKTKTFYDPETGKYVQLNVRQRSQVALTQPASVEMLNAPYVLYPGFVPMAASSLPVLRSSSQMSAPATLTEEQDRLKTGSETWRQNVYQQNNRRDVQQYPEIVYRSYEQIHDPSLYTENNVAKSESHTDIITMSELEDFAMEST
ncbi:uncharacterized protein LOC127411700 [Myxocyprinus asiaticus]|uniref:uncharacterized protein LOC127411700 n=1 Tax=Myxocyprinus asiaticus TaxID=70543 RepID=UPI002223352C|nr:uncharacterized protein LOC127411700 [Myxocyprinus asiaticus]